MGRYHKLKTNCFTKLYYSCKYSATKTRKIILKSLTTFSSTFDIVSVALCHTLGNGTGIKWRIGTPLSKNGISNKNKGKEIVTRKLEKF